MAIAEEEKRLREMEERRIREQWQLDELRRQAEARMRREAAERWWDEMILHFGWFKALPDVVQPMLAAGLICVPLVALTVVAMRSWLPLSPPIAPDAPEPATPPSPSPVDPPNVQFARKVGALDFESKRILARFLAVPEGSWVDLDPEETSPKLLVLGGFLTRGSLEPSAKTDYRMMPHRMSPEVRAALADSPELNALRQISSAGELGEWAASEGSSELSASRNDDREDSHANEPASDVESWPDKLAGLSDQSKTLLRRFQNDGLDSILYLEPREVPPPSLIELGAVVREWGIPPFGDKIPYTLGSAAKNALREHPEVTR